MLPLGSQQAGEALGRHRFAEQVALAKIATCRLHGAQLLYGFDTLGDRNQSEIVGEPDHTADEDALARARFCYDERAIDLELVGTDFL